MKISIQEDMYEVMEQLPEDQGDRLLRALVEFGFSGVEPERSEEAWYYLFLAFRGRIQLSAKRSADGTSAINRRWGNEANDRCDEGTNDRSCESTNHRCDEHTNDRSDGCTNDRCDEGTNDRSCESTNHRCDEHTNDRSDGCTNDRCIEGTNDTENENESEIETENEEEEEKEREEWRAQVRDATALFVSHLNSSCGTTFRASSSATQRLVSGRLKEGYTAEDLCKVADGMAALWLHDPKMSQYLRPETLLRPSKFEGYLQRARSRAPSRSFSEFALPADEVIVSA